MLLTRIPFGNGTKSGVDVGARWAAAHLPLVGACLGLMGAAVWGAFQRVDAGVCAWLVIGALLLLTGALHEDGLADTADALGGAFTRPRLFEILKDSRIGSYGAVALVTVLALRAALLTRLLVECCWVLVLSQTASRLAPVLLLRCLPYVSPNTTSRSQHHVKVQNAHLVLAGMWTLGVCAALVCFTHLTVRRVVLSLAAQALTVLWIGWRVHRRAGGVTGDFLGAAQQLGELALLLGLAAS